MPDDAISWQMALALNLNDVIVREKEELKSRKLDLEDKDLAISHPFIEADVGRMKKTVHFLDKLMEMLNSEQNASKEEVVNFAAKFKADVETAIRLAAETLKYPIEFGNIEEDRIRKLAKETDSVVRFIYSYVHPHALAVAVEVNAIIKHELELDDLRKLEEAKENENIEKHG